MYGLSRADKEFIEEETLVQIVPSVHIPLIKLHSQSYGPFRPLVAAHVPKWLAISMHEKKRCQLIHPEKIEKIEWTEAIKVQNVDLKVLESGLDSHCNLMEECHPAVLDAMNTLIMLESV